MGVPPSAASCAASCAPPLLVERFLLCRPPFFGFDDEDTDADTTDADTDAEEEGEDGEKKKKKKKKEKKKKKREKKPGEDDGDKPVKRFLQKQKTYGDVMARDAPTAKIMALRKKKRKGQYFNEAFFKEKASSGRFRRVFHKLDRAGHRVDLEEAAERAAARAARRGDPDSPEAVGRMMETVAYLVNTVFLFCQGLLAGVALLHLYLTFQTTSDERFLSVYSQTAGQARKTIRLGHPFF